MQELINKLNLVASYFLLLLFLLVSSSSSTLFLHFYGSSTLFRPVLCSEQSSQAQSSDFHFTFLVETRMAYFLLFRHPNADITVPVVPVPLVVRDIAWFSHLLFCPCLCLCLEDPQTSSISYLQFTGLEV